MKCIRKKLSNTFQKVTHHYDNVSLIVAIPFNFISFTVQYRTEPCSIRTGEKTHTNNGLERGFDLTGKWYHHYHIQQQFSCEDARKEDGIVIVSVRRGKKSQLQWN